MTETQKRQLFWLLKRFSSITYWKKFKQAFEPFIGEYEYAVTHTSDSSVTGEYLKEYLDTIIAFEKGIEKLQRGERHVFKAEHPEHYLQLADYGVYVAWRVTDPKEYVLDWMPNFERIRAIAVNAYKFAKNPVLEDGLQTDRPQLRIRPNGQFRSVEKDEPIEGPYPTLLPAVPEPLDIEIPTGGIFPVYGIYQPYVVKPGKGLLFPSSPKLEEFGCMHYWLEGIEAPQSTAWESRPKPESADVIWKLLWEDTRYVDGTIPEEEKSYFPAEGEALATATSEHYRIMPGQACPKTGDWMVGHSPKTRGHFNEGDIMPELNLPNGATIWMFVESTSS